MPNLAYNRSTRRERELVNWYRANGWDSSRSAGSKGKWDVWAHNPITGQVEMTQIKTKKGGKNVIDKVLSSKDGLVKTIWRTYGA